MYLNLIISLPSADMVLTANQVIILFFRYLMLSMVLAALLLIEKHFRNDNQNLILRYHSTPGVDFS